MCGIPGDFRTDSVTIDFGRSLANRCLGVHACAGPVNAHMEQPPRQQLRGRCPCTPLGIRDRRNSRCTGSWRKPGGSAEHLMAEVARTRAGHHEVSPESPGRSNQPVPQRQRRRREPGRPSAIIIPICVSLTCSRVSANFGWFAPSSARRRLHNIPQQPCKRTHRAAVIVARAAGWKV